MVYGVAVMVKILGNVAIVVEKTTLRISFLLNTLTSVLSSSDVVIREEQH